MSGKDFKSTNSGSRARLQHRYLYNTVYTRNRSISNLFINLLEVTLFRLLL